MCFIFWKTRWNRQTHHLSHHIPRTQIQFTAPGGPGMISLQKDLVWWENFGFRRTSSWSLPFGDKLKRVSMERVFTSLYVTICDMMRVVALCDYMWTGLFVVYIYIHTQYIDMTICQCKTGHTSVYMAIYHCPKVAAVDYVKSPHRRVWERPAMQGVRSQSPGTGAVVQVACCFTTRGYTGDMTGICVHIYIYMYAICMYIYVYIYI